MMIKKLLSVTLFGLLGHAAWAQDTTGKAVVDTTKAMVADTTMPKKTPPPVSPTTPTGKKQKKQVVVAAPKQENTNPTAAYDALNLANRPNDHFLIELGYNNWVGTPDTINVKGIGRTFAFYFMLDFPFKTDPHWSIGAGLGISVDNIYFNKQQVLVGANNATLAFPDQSSTDHFKKNKLVTTFLEVPIELRYCFDPANPNKSWKMALGVKPGVLLSSYFKGKNLLNEAGQLEQQYISKSSSKKYFNSARVDVSYRITYNFIGLFGTYSITPLLKSSAGAVINPYTIGLVLSGL